MRVALAGLGSAAHRGHLPAIDRLAPRVTLVAAADPDANRRAILARARSDIRLFPSATDMLESVRCDVMVIATEPMAHCELIVLGIEHGCHVLCEKPVAFIRAELAAINAICNRRQDLALIPVHQYRYSPYWAWIVRWLRIADLSKRPCRLTVTIERSGTDRNAVSPWRLEVGRSGGMLADSGVHFLALAWGVRKRIDLISATRRLDAAGHEQSLANYSIGLSSLQVHATNAACKRRTWLRLCAKPVVVDWEDDLARLQVAGRTLRSHRVPSLSDRSHVDALYNALYREIVRSLPIGRWRARRTHEALAVSEALAATLERAPITP